MSTLAITQENSRFLNKLSGFAQYFQAQAPENMAGLPQQLVNPMQLALVSGKYSNTDEVPAEELDTCYDLIEYYDGAAIVNGMPIWGPLEGEAGEYYQLFLKYRDMKEERGHRSLMRLINETDVPGRFLTQLSRAYLWQLRCELYDKYQLGVLDCMAEKGRLDMIESHKNASVKLLKMSLDYFEKHKDAMNPKIALQMAELAVKVGRESYGLSSGRGGGSAATINIQNNLDQQNSKIEMPKNAKEDVTIDYAQSILNVLGQTGALEPKVVDIEEEDMDIVPDSQYVDAEVIE